MTTEWRQLTTAGGDSAGQSDFDREILLIFITAIGVVSNTFAIIVLSRYKKLYSRLGSVLILNQCLIDLCASILSLSYWIWMLEGEMFHSPWKGAAGQLHCRVWVTGVFHWSLMTSSTYNLLMITLERYGGAISSNIANHLIPSQQTCNKQNKQKQYSRLAYEKKRQDGRLRRL